MGRWHGPSYKGARRALQAVKRTEAERRNTATPVLRRRQARLMLGRTTISVAAFSAAMEELYTTAGIGRDQLISFCEAFTNEPGEDLPA